MKIEVYSFEDSDGTESTYTTQDIREAETHARKHRLRLIANIYEWADSETVEDNTPRKRRRAKG